MNPSGVTRGPPSPSKHAMRKERLTPHPPCQTQSGMNLSAAFLPISSASGLDLNASMFWTSSSKIRFRSTRVCRSATYRAPPTTWSYAKSTSSKKCSSVLLKPARPSEAQPSLTQAPASTPSIDSSAVGTMSIQALRATHTTVPGWISSSWSHWNSGTPTTGTRQSTRWLWLPRTLNPDDVVMRLVGCRPELKPLLAWTALPSLSNTSTSRSTSEFSSASTSRSMRTLEPSARRTLVSPVTQ